MLSEIPKTRTTGEDASGLDEVGKEADGNLGQATEEDQVPGVQARVVDVRDSVNPDRAGGGNEKD